MRAMDSSKHARIKPSTLRAASRRRCERWRNDRPDRCTSAIRRNVPGCASPLYRALPQSTLDGGGPACGAPSLYEAYDRNIISFLASNTGNLGLIHALRGRAACRSRPIDPNGAVLQTADKEARAARAGGEAAAGSVRGRRAPVFGARDRGACRRQGEYRQ
jgi:hypothetical protein